MGAGDFRTALAVLQDEAKLEALYPATKTELTGQGGAPLYPPLGVMVAALVKAEQTGGPEHAEERCREPGAGATAVGSEAVS